MDWLREVILRGQRNGEMNGIACLIPTLHNITSIERALMVAARRYITGGHMWCAPSTPALPAQRIR